MPRRMRGNRHHGRDMIADPHCIAFTDQTIERRDLVRLGCGTGDDAASRRLDRRIAADMVAMPMGVPDLTDAPSSCGSGFEHRLCDGRVDRDRLATLRIMQQPDIIVGEHGNADHLQHRIHHCPILGIDTQGSAGSRRPSCNSSIEMPSGVRTNAIWPSRGGRLMVTPASRKRWHVS